MHIIYCINGNIISSKISHALLITLCWVFVCFNLFFLIFEEGRGGGKGLLFFVEKKPL